MKTGQKILFRKRSFSGLGEPEHLTLVTTRQPFKDVKQFVFVKTEDYVEGLEDDKYPLGALIIYSEGFIENLADMELVD